MSDIFSIYHLPIVSPSVQLSCCCSSNLCDSHTKLTLSRASWATALFVGWGVIVIVNSNFDQGQGQGSGVQRGEPSNEYGSPQVCLLIKLTRSWTKRGRLLNPWRLLAWPTFHIL